MSERLQPRPSRQGFREDGRRHASGALCGTANITIHSRFTPLELPRWSESEEFRRLLAAFEAALPLKRPSELTQRPLVQYLSAVSGGLLGEVSRLLNDAAEAAIRDGSERITLGHLEHVANRPS